MEYACIVWDPQIRRDTQAIEYFPESLLMILEIRLQHCP